MSASAPSNDTVDERGGEPATSTTANTASTSADTNETEGTVVDERKVTPPLPLDWTRIHKEQELEEKVIRYPWTVAEIDIQDDELCIVGTAGQKVTNMGNLGEHCNPKLKKLILRSNLVKTMEGIGAFEELELLELYDNMVDGLAALDEGPNGAPGMTLKTLDMSYNAIRSMEPVSLCPNLRELYLANNKLKTITGLSELKSLVKIDLGANKIRVIEGLDGLVNLEELWLGKNKIEEIQGIDKLTKLRRLDVQSNRLTIVANLKRSRMSWKSCILVTTVSPTKGPRIRRDWR